MQTAARKLLAFRSYRVAIRRKSNPDKAEPPFENCPKCLKLSDNGQRVYEFGQASLMIIMIIGIVYLIDTLSGRLRQMLIGKQGR
jgi:hypothetical protein